MDLISKYQSRFARKAWENGMRLYNKHLVKYSRQEDTAYYFQCLDQVIVLQVYRNDISYWNCTCNERKPCAHIAGAIIALHTMLANKQQALQHNEMSAILQRHRNLRSPFEQRSLLHELNERLDQLKVLVKESPKDVLKELDALCKYLELSSYRWRLSYENLMLIVQEVIKELKQTKLKKQVLVWLTKNLETTTSSQMASFYVVCFLAGDDADKMEPILLKLMQEAAASLTKESKQAIMKEVLQFPFACDPIDEQWEAIFLQEELEEEVFNAVYQHFEFVGKKDVALRMAHEYILQERMSPVQLRNYLPLVNAELRKTKNAEAMLAVMEKGLLTMREKQIWSSFNSCIRCMIKRNGRQKSFLF